MARHMNRVWIDTYRGIRNLDIEDLGDINILVGDNNCGKTSLLEAIQILSRPLDFNNLVMTARQRDRFRLAMSARMIQTHFNSFLNIFDREGRDLRISLGCDILENFYNVQLIGEVKKTLLTADEIEGIKKERFGNAAIDEEIEAFIGGLSINKASDLIYELLANEDEDSIQSVKINKFSRIVRPNNAPQFFSAVYLSPAEHIVNDKFRAITRSRALTSDVVDLLSRTFDNRIVDLRILEDDDGRTYQAVEHRTLGFMPLSTYGDGIRKVITLAGAAAGVKDGILLVDEYETAIHTSAMKSVFSFMINMCKERKLQLFLTTHSLEAVDELLKCGEDNLGDIRVITLKKNGEDTFARVLSGVKADELRFDNDAELR